MILCVHFFRRLMDLSYLIQYISMGKQDIKKAQIYNVDR